MPDVMDMIRSNPEMVQVSPENILAATPQVNADNSASTMSWAAARRGRARQTLSQDPIAESDHIHHQAVADTSAYLTQSQKEHAMATAAQIQHDTGAYYQEAGGIHPSDPDYEMKHMALAAKYPFARPDAQLMQPSHEARRTFMTASNELNKFNQAETTAKMEQGTLTAMQKGVITPNDLNDPAFRNQDGSLNHRLLNYTAAAREGQKSQALTPDERAVLKAYPDSKSVHKLINASDDDPATRMQKSLFWSAYHKSVGGGTPAATKASSAQDWSKNLGF